MAKNVTRWSPDTCGCVIEYEWDTEVPQEEREHRAVMALPCRHHAAVAAARGASPHSAVFEAVLAENRRKNYAVAAVLEATGLSGEVVGFRYDDARKLTIRVPKAETSRRKSLQSAVDARIGKGQATVIEE